MLMRCWDVWSGGFIPKQMLVVFRITRKLYAADLTGEGAHRYGGRWNQVGVACLYASESRALAMLEYAVHTTAQTVARDLVMLTLEVPEQQYMQVRRDRLPKDWQAFPAPASTINLGSMLLQDTSLQVVGVPSVIIPEEYNFLLNYRNMPSGYPVLQDMAEIGFDFRIKG
jgi:RES domain-containing protein